MDVIASKKMATRLPVAEICVDGDAVTPLYILAVVAHVGFDAFSVVFWDVSFVKCDDMAWVGCRKAGFVCKIVRVVMNYA